MKTDKWLTNDMLKVILFTYKLFTIYLLDCNKQ